MKDASAIFCIQNMDGIKQMSDNCQHPKINSFRFSSGETIKKCADCNEFDKEREQIFKKIGDAVEFPEDEQLVSDYKSGNESAFSMLFEKNSKLIRYYCWNEVSRFPNSEDLADDLAQATWMDLSSYLLKFKQDCSFHTIAKLVARNRALKWVRDNEQEQELSTNDEEVLKEIVDMRFGPVDQDLAVNDLLKSLNSEEKALVIAMVFEGHTAEEDDLAGKLGVDQSTVIRRFDRALEKLRDTLTEDSNGG